MFSPERYGRVSCSLSVPVGFSASSSASSRSGQVGSSQFKPVHASSSQFKPVQARSGSRQGQREPPGSAAASAASAPGTPVAIAGSLKGKAKAGTPVVEANPQEAAGASPLVQEEPESQGIIARFLSPLSVFLPVVVLDPSPYGIGHRKRRDWSLTMLAVALFGFMLSTVSSLFLLFIEGRGC